MENKSRIEIPEYIVRDEDKQKFVESFSGKLQACNNAYKSLLAMPDLENIPDNLQDINAEAVENFINERLSEIEATKMMTAEAKRNAKEDWGNIRQEALSHISAIKEVLATYPDADITVSKGEVVCNNLDELVTERCKVKTPDGVKEHANLILEVKDAIDALWKFEREHDLPTGSYYTIEKDLEMVAAPIGIIEHWLLLAQRKEYVKKRPWLQGACVTQMKMKNSTMDALNARLEKIQKERSEKQSEYFMPTEKKETKENTQRESADCLGYSAKMK